MSIILSLLSGGATGILGTILSGILKYFTIRQQQKHDVKKMELELKHMTAEAERAERIASIEAESAEQIAKIEAESAERKAELNTLKASYKEATTRFSTGEHPALIWVDVVRGLMRPVLTLGLVFLVGLVFFNAGSDVDTISLDAVIQSCLQYGQSGDTLRECITTQMDEVSLHSRIISTVLYLATAAVLWWFGSRQVEKAVKK